MSKHYQRQITGLVCEHTIYKLWMCSIKYGEVHAYIQYNKCLVIYTFNIVWSFFQNLLNLFVVCWCESSPPACNQKLAAVMATQKPGGWVQSLITRFDSQVCQNYSGMIHKIMECWQLICQLLPDPVHFWLRWLIFMTVCIYQSWIFTASCEKKWVLGRGVKWYAFLILITDFRKSIIVSEIAGLLETTGWFPFGKRQCKGCGAASFGCWCCHSLTAVNALVCCLCWSGEQCMSASSYPEVHYSGLGHNPLKSAPFSMGCLDHHLIIQGSLALQVYLPDLHLNRFSHFCTGHWYTQYQL